MRMDGKTIEEYNSCSKYPIAERNRRAKMRFLVGLTEHYENKKKDIKEKNNPQPEEKKIDYTVPGTPISSRDLSAIRSNEDSGVEDNHLPDELLVSDLIINRFVKQVNMMKDFEGEEEDVRVEEHHKNPTTDVLDNFITEMERRNSRVDQYFEASKDRNTYRRSLTEVYEWSSLDGRDIKVPGVPIESKSLIKINTYFDESNRRNSYKREFSEVVSFLEQQNVKSEVYSPLKNEEGLIDDTPLTVNWKDHESIEVSESVAQFLENLDIKSNDVLIYTNDDNESLDLHDEPKANNQVKVKAEVNTARVFDVVKVSEKGAKIDKNTKKVISEEIIGVDFEENQNLGDKQIFKNPNKAEINSGRIFLVNKVSEDESEVNNQEKVDSSNLIGEILEEKLSSENNKKKNEKTETEFNSGLVFQVTTDSENVLEANRPTEEDYLKMVEQIPMKNKILEKNSEVEFLEHVLEDNNFPDNESNINNKIETNDVPVGIVGENKVPTTVVEPNSPDEKTESETKTNKVLENEPTSPIKVDSKSIEKTVEENKNESKTDNRIRVKSEASLSKSKSEDSLFEKISYKGDETDPNEYFIRSERRQSNDTVQFLSRVKELPHWFGFHQNISSKHEKGEKSSIDDVKKYFATSLLEKACSLLPMNGDGVLFITDNKEIDDDVTSYSKENQKY